MLHIVHTHCGDKSRIVYLNTHYIMSEHQSFPRSAHLSRIGQQHRHTLDRAKPMPSPCNGQTQPTSRGCWPGADVPEFDEILQRNDSFVPLRLEHSNRLSHLPVLHGLT